MAQPVRERTANVKLSVNDFLVLLRGLYSIRWSAGPGGKWLIITICLASFGSAALEGFGIGMLIPLLDLLQDSNGSSTIGIRVDPPPRGDSILHYNAPGSGAHTVPLRPDGGATLPVRSAGRSPAGRPIELLRRWLPDRSLTTYVLLMCGIVLTAMTFKNVLLYITQRLSSVLRRRISIRLRQALFEHFQNVDLGVLEKRTTGELANVIVTEAGRTGYAVEFLSIFGQRCSIAFCYLAALLLISWQLTFMTAVLAVIIGLLMNFAYRRLSVSGDLLSELNSKLNRRLMEAFSGTRVIRALYGQPFESRTFLAINQEQARVNEETAETTALIAPVTEVMAVAGAMCIIGTATVFLVRPGLLAGEMLLGFALILLRFQPLLNQIYGLYGQVINLASAPSVVRGWLQTARFPFKPFGEKDFKFIQNDISVREVSYVYPNGHVALDRVSFSIEAGQTTALVGASGSGKSTMAALLLRLREPTQGRILADGEDYWNFTPESWHRPIGFVDQDAFFFQETVAYNLCYGISGEVTEAQMWAALRKANLDSVVEQLPHGLNSILGERGATLSGGQRQRLSIARALVRDPQLLILDEATSALDSISEQQVQEAINEAQEGRTVVVIAHRFSTIRRADKIVVFDQGRVVEQGSWEDLMSRNGEFARLLEASTTALV